MKELEQNTAELSTKILLADNSVEVVEISSLSSNLSIYRKNLWKIFWNDKYRAELTKEMK